MKVHDARRTGPSSQGPRIGKDGAQPGRGCLPAWDNLGAQMSAGMRTSWIQIGIAAGLLTAGSLSAETLYEWDGITLEGSARLVHHDAATCQVLAESESPETYEATKANHGRALHVWRLDCGAFNGSGKSLGQLTGYLRIESEWPPCTTWTGLGQYSGPVQWVGSSETPQRTDGLEPGGEASETLYLLALDGQHPLFSRWQLNFRLGEVTTPSEPKCAPATALELTPPPVPELLFDAEHENDSAKWFNCWQKLASPLDCHVWTGESSWPEDPEWTGECIDVLAVDPAHSSPMGGIPTRKQDGKRESTGAFRAGKKHGPWVALRVDGLRGEGPQIDCQRQGRWISDGFDGDDPRSSLIEIYKNGERIDYGRRSNAGSSRRRGLRRDGFLRRHVFQVDAEGVGSHRRFLSGPAVRVVILNAIVDLPEPAISY